MTPEELADAVPRCFGPAASSSVSHGLRTVDVPSGMWLAAVTSARHELCCDFFDWLSAVDEGETGLAVLTHLYSTTGRHRLLLRARLPLHAPRLHSVAGVYSGANWHERETHEMFGIEFAGHPNLIPLLLPEGFEGHPLRKDFVLASRVAKPWPGQVEPGHAKPSGRRPKRPPGVPDPQAWGPA
jgi:NADH-quinone oxidoreductase subunit C